MKRRSYFNALIAAPLIGSFALSSCGIRGELKTPPPVWGEDVRTAKEMAEDAKMGKSANGISVQAPEPVE